MNSIVCYTTFNSVCTMTLKPVRDRLRGTLSAVKVHAYFVKLKTTTLVKWQTFPIVKMLSIFLPLILNSATKRNTLEIYAVMPINLCYIISWILRIILYENTLYSSENFEIINNRCFSLPTLNWTDGV